MQFYFCEPNIVVFDSLSKETMLFASYSAAVIRFLSTLSEESFATLTQLKEKSMQYCNDDIDSFDGCLSQLLHMKIIEPIEWY